MKHNTTVRTIAFGGILGKGVKPMMAGLICIALLMTGCPNGRDDPIWYPEDEAEYQSLENWANQQATANGLETQAEQLEFPCFAIVARETTIKAKILELWRKHKDNMTKELVQRQIKVKDGLFVRKLNMGNGESFPLLSEKEAKQLYGDVGTIYGWNLCFMDCVGSGASATVSVQRADNPYLVLCKREFRLMSELCQHLGAKSVVITDSEKRYEEVGKHGEAALKIKTKQFGGAGNADYEETYSQYTKSFAEISAEFNEGKGAAKIKRGHENYTPALKARLDKHVREFCDLEEARMRPNQITHWAWEYSYEEKGDKNLKARLEIGCRILDIGGLASASWQKTEKWERQKKWYLIATFPKSEIVD